MDEDTLTEKHTRISNPDDKGVTYRYNVENGELILVSFSYHYIKQI